MSRPGEGLANGQNHHQLFHFMKTSLFTKATMSALLMIAALSTSSQAQQVVYSMDFTTQPAGDAMPWLRENGFEFKLAFEYLNPRFENGALRLSTESEEAGVAGIILAEGKELRNVNRVRIEWGVDVYPEGSDWENGVNRPPLAVMISFGRERISSGLPFKIYAAPYFISPFIGKLETHGKAYTGRFWKEGGRYVCTKLTAEKEPMVTELELPTLFKTLYSKEAPPITAIGIQMNTEDTKGRASAWLKKIEFLRD